MLLFGVTGGIASGKSAVCQLLQEKGIAILAADPLARKLTMTSSEIRQALKAKFGDEVYTPSGELNKKKLRALVFSSPETREQVNRIIHPHILKWIEQEAGRLSVEEGHRLIGVEAALIYESGMDDSLDAVVVVEAPLDRRIQWLQQRDQLTGEEILRRFDAQMPVPEKIRRADYVLENSGGLPELARKVDDLFDWLRQRAGD
ncbi:MAG: dephospho-CoA kinase [bacterium]